jgi:hypothetical protein
MHMTPALWTIVFLSAIVSLPGAAKAVDINTQLKACSAEKKALGDVPSCGKKWKIESSQAKVTADGSVTVEVRGLVLDDVSVGDANGSPDGVDAIFVAVLCGGKLAAQADSVPLSKQGDATFVGRLSVPTDCASPVVLVRERYEGRLGGWLAASGQ